MRAAATGSTATSPAGSPRWPTSSAACGGEPDAGIWEVRSEQRHFTQSKMMCWIALDRACELAGRGVIPGRHAERWREEADAIGEFVETRCYSASQAKLRARGRLRRARREPAARRPVLLRRPEGRPLDRDDRSAAPRADDRSVRAPLHRRGRPRRRRGRVPDAARSGSRKRLPARGASTTPSG